MMLVSLPRNGSGGILRVYLYFLHGKEFRVVFSLGCSIFAYIFFSLQSETKRTEIRFAFVSLVRFEVFASFFSQYSLIFASNFSLCFASLTFYWILIVEYEYFHIQSVQCNVYASHLHICTVYWTGYELICSTGGHQPRPPPGALPPPPYTLFRVQRLFCDSLTCTNATYVKSCARICKRLWSGEGCRADIFKLSRSPRSIPRNQFHQAVKPGRPVMATLFTLFRLGS